MYCDYIDNLIYHLDINRIDPLSMRSVTPTSRRFTLLPYGMLRLVLGNQVERGSIDKGDQPCLSGTFRTGVRMLKDPGTQSARSHPSDREFTGSIWT